LIAGKVPKRFLIQGKFWQLGMHEILLRINPTPAKAPAILHEFQLRIWEPALDFKTKDQSPMGGIAN
jgi:hypothetical protein